MEGKGSMADQLSKKKKNSFSLSHGRIGRRIEIGSMPHTIHENTITKS